jgi:hypothetical protein
MATLILRRAAADAASPDEATGLVASLSASVVHRSERTLLVEVTDEAQVGALRQGLPGWVVSLQGPRIPIPDTRLKLRSSGQ